MNTPKPSRQAKLLQLYASHIDKHPPGYIHLTTEEHRHIWRKFTSKFTISERTYLEQVRSHHLSRLKVRK